MATKIRLQRGGRKSYAFYSIVIADARAPRDGRFTEKIGSYNPNTNPATVDLNFDRALYWLEVGAQPTDTVRNILSREGVLLMNNQSVEFMVNGEVLQATASREVDYEGTEVDMSIYINDTGEFMKGVYSLEVYTGQSLLGRAECMLR